MLNGQVQNALNPAQRLTQYNRDTWSRDEGLPSNSVLSLLQTSDGYVWFGTFDGLVRFSGVQFSVFSRANTSGIKNNGMWSIVEAKNPSDGAQILWIATNGGGLLRYSHGKFTSFGTESGLPSDVVLTLLRNSSTGALWIGTRKGLALRTQLSSGRDTILALPKDAGLPAAPVQSLLLDDAQRLWVGTAQGLFVQTSPPNDPKHRFTPAFQDSPFADSLRTTTIKALRQDRLGTLWIGTLGKGVFAGQNGTLTNYTTAQGLPDNRVQTIMSDSAGTLWLGTMGGLVRKVASNQGSTIPIFEVLSKKEGLTDNQVWSLTADREGSLWIGTYRGGLNRLKNGKFQTYTTQEGLVDDYAYSVQEASDGTLWISTAEGLSGLKNGAFTNFTKENGLPDNMVRMTASSPDGALWIATYQGLCRFAGGKFTTFTTKEGLPENRVRSVFAAADGTVWVGTNAGFARVVDGKCETIMDDKGILKGTSVISIRGAKDGSLTICTEGKGWCRFKDGQVIEHWTAKKGLLSDVVMFSYQDSDGAVWIASNAGFQRLKGGVLTAFTLADGLQSESVYNISEDTKGNFWLGGNDGIQLVSKQALNTLAEAKIQKQPLTSLETKLFGRWDGMKSGQVSAPSMPCTARNGVLWIPTLRGIVGIDPANVRYNALPPPVKIERMTSERDTANILQPVRFRAGTQRFIIEYTALSYLAPSRVRFRVKLEGVDSDWENVGARREASYMNLPPGTYTFHVRATNNDGVWNDEGASLTFEILPYFYQTWWFRTASVLALLLLAAWVVRYRLRQSGVREAELVALVKERTESVVAEKEKAEIALRDAQFTKALAEMAQTKVEKRSRLLAESVEHILRSMETIARGNLLAHVHLSEEYAENADIMRLAQGINETVATMRSIVSGVVETADSVSSSTKDISATLRDLTHLVEQQSGTADTASHDIRVIATSIGENAAQMLVSVQTAHNERHAAREGAEIVERTRAKIHEIARLVEVSSASVSNLAALSDTISEIAETIQSIADQTNLLALNAAIEAARAGDQGRGFAVVADEVRKLAENTATATKQISATTRTIQSEIQHAVTALAKGASEMQSGMQLADRTGTVLRGIVESAEATTSNLERIAANSKQQTRISTEAVESIEQMHLSTQEAALGVEEIARSAEELRNRTLAMQQQVARFQV
jgi:methyl-accepting chemotaxis protein/ligand-binding sensor domain-containing protein